MQKSEHIEGLFHLLDKSSQYISQVLHKSYLEALIDTGESIAENELVMVHNEEQKEALEKLYQGLDWFSYDQEERRRAFQLAMIKGMKQYSIPGAIITPDSVAMFMGYLAKLYCHPSKIFDPAVGSGNLLTSVLNQYKEPVKEVFGTEIDPMLIRLAYVNANLQEHQMELYHQDGLKTLFASSFDLIVSDLPIGEYENDKIAQKYSMYQAEQDNLIHHLMIEKSIQVSIDGAYLIIMAPNDFLEESNQKLRELLLDQTYIHMMLQLPANLFQIGSKQKSIFVLQKKGGAIKKPRQSMVARIPSFSNSTAMNKFLIELKSHIDGDQDHI